MNLKAGQTIGPYLVMRLIDEMPWRADYLIREQTSSREAISSVFNVSAENQKPFTADLTRRAQAIAALDSPNFIELHTLGALNDGGPLVVSSPTYGATLTDSLKSSTRWSNPVQALTLIRNLTKILLAAAQKNIYHNTLSPQTISILENDDIIITDIHVPLISEEQLLGSLDYAPPEQTFAEPMTEMGTIYTLGLILYELLASQHPKASGWDVARMGDDRLEPPSLDTMRTGLTEGTYDLVQTALHTSPQTRTATLEQFLQRIEKVLDGEQIQQSLTQQIVKRKNVATSQKRLVGDEQASRVVQENAPVGEKMAAAAVEKPSAPKWRIPLLLLIGLIAVGLLGSFALGVFSPSDAETVEIVPTITKAKGFTLINPLPGQFFAEETTIYFAWSFGRKLQASEQFQVTLINADGDELLLDPVTKPLNGNTYRMETSGFPAGEYEWQVALYESGGSLPTQSSITLPISITPPAEEDVDSAGSTTITVTNSSP